MNNDLCEVTVIHHERIDEVKKSMIEEDKINTLSMFFKVLADETRLRIISVLLNHEMCVCDIAYLLNLSQSLISHQLRVLREARLVKRNKVGKVVYYSLDDQHVKELLNSGIVHISE